MKVLGLNNFIINNKVCLPILGLNNFIIDNRICLLIFLIFNKQF